MSALLGFWYILSKIGGYLTHQFPASLLEPVGNALTAAGNAALSAFVTVLLVALIVIAIILYIREKINHPY